MNAQEDTVVIMDDFGGAVHAVQLAAMQCLHGGRLNGMQIPDCVRWVVCTNRRADSPGIQAIVEPVKSRATIIELAVDAEDWCVWAERHGMPEDLVDFIYNVPDALHEFSPSSEIVNCPTPRNWAELGRYLKVSSLPERLLIAVCTGRVGLARGVQYAEYRKMYRDKPGLEEILKHPETAEVPERNPNLMLAVCAGLASRAKVENLGSIFTYVRRFRSREYVAEILADIERRKPELVNTQEFVKMRLENQDLYL